MEIAEHRLSIIGEPLSRPQVLRSRGRASRSVCLEQWIDAHRAGEPVGGPLPDGYEVCWVNDVVTCARRITGTAAVAPTTF